MGMECSALCNAPEYSLGGRKQTQGETEQSTGQGDPRGLWLGVTTDHRNGRCEGIRLTAIRKYRLKAIKQRDWVSFTKENVAPSNSLLW